MRGLGRKPESRPNHQKTKNHPQDGFGNAFGNKGVVSLQTLVIPIDLAEEVRFELTEDFHPRQFSRLVHSTALPLFLCSEVANYKELLLNPA